MNRTFEVIKSLISCTIKNDFAGLAAEMSYNLTLSIFPFAIFAVALFGLLGTQNAVNTIVNLLSTIAPAGTLDLVGKVLTDILAVPSNTILSFTGLLGSLWAASGAVRDVMKGINRAYNIPETRSFFKIAFLSIIAVIVLVLMLFLSVNLIIFGTWIFQALTSKMQVNDMIFNVVYWVRWPIAFLVIFFIMIIVYYFLPDIKANKRELLISSIPGAIFFSLFWLLGSWGFRIYVENFAHYNSIYGTLGTFVVLLVWFYYSSLVMLIGGGLCSEIYKIIRPKVVEFRYQND